MGRRTLHVEEERRRAATSVHLPLAPLGVLALLLAVLAADRERQCAQSLLGDLLTALETVPVVTVIEPVERIVDLVERLRLHLDERKLQILLDVRFRAL